MSWYNLVEQHILQLPQPCQPGKLAFQGQHLRTSLASCAHPPSQYMSVNPFFLPNLIQISPVLNSKPEPFSQVKLEKRSPIKLTGSNPLRGPKILGSRILVFSIECSYMRVSSLPITKNLQGFLSFHLCSIHLQK